MSGAERLLCLIAEATEAATYMPVQRSNHAGYRFGSDMVAAIPIPLWESIVEAADQAAEERELVAERDPPSPERIAAIREALERSHAGMSAHGELWETCKKCRYALAALDELTAALSAETERAEQHDTNCLLAQRRRDEARAERDSLAVQLEQARAALRYIADLDLSEWRYDQTGNGVHKLIAIAKACAALAALPEAPPTEPTDTRRYAQTSGQ